MKKIYILLLLISIEPKLTLGQTFYKFINFDDGQNMAYIKIDNMNPSNIWQIGKPQKSFFNKAFSLPNVMVTDTITSYPINNLSTFYIYIPVDSESYVFGQQITFYYKIFSDNSVHFKLKDTQLVRI
jgi:hypothetical protein